MVDVSSIRQTFQQKMPDVNEKEVPTPYSDAQNSILKHQEDLPSYERDRYKKGVNNARLQELKSTISSLPGKGIAEAGFDKIDQDTGDKKWRFSHIRRGDFSKTNRSVSAEMAGKALNRMNALVAPVAAQEKKVNQIKKELKALGDPQTIEQDLRALKEDAENDSSNAPSGTGTNLSDTQKRKLQINMLERKLAQIKTTRNELNQAEVDLKDMQENPMTASRFGRIQEHLSVAKDDPRLRRAFADHSASSVGGNWADEKLADAKGAVSDPKTAATNQVPFVSSMRHEQRANRIDNVREYQNPAGRAFCDALSNRLYNTSAVEAIGSAGTVATAPLALASHGASNIVLHPLSTMAANAATHKLHSEAGKFAATESIKQGMSIAKKVVYEDKLKQKVADMSPVERSGQGGAMPAPVVAVQVDGGKKTQYVELTEKKAAKAMMQYLAPPKRFSSSEKEMKMEEARMGLRRELFCVDPTDKTEVLKVENFSPKRPKWTGSGAQLGKTLNEKYKRLDEALNYKTADPTLDVNNDREVLEQYHPIELLYSAQGYK